MPITQLNLTINEHYVRLYGFKKGFEPFKKPNLVFLHGLLGNSQNWSFIAKKLAKDFQILTYDLRGHGRTDKLSKQDKLSEQGEHYEPEVFSEDLIGILDELGWKKASAVGHSLGGRILMVCASKHPKRFEKLIIEDVGPQKTGEASRRTEAMIDFVPTPFKSRLEAKAFFRDLFLPRYGEVLSDYLYGNLTKNEFGQMDWRFDKAGVLSCIRIGHARDFWKSYKAISAEHLVVRGETSEHLPREVMKEMVESNVNAESVEISGAGHWVHFDQGALFMKELTRFLHR